jgi:hypothetical protein
MEMSVSPIEEKKRKIAAPGSSKSGGEGSSKAAHSSGSVIWLQFSILFDQCITILGKMKMDQKWYENSCTLYFSTHMQWLQ